VLNVFLLQIVGIMVNNFLPIDLNIFFDKLSLFGAVITAERRYALAELLL
jgi:hypothetical protein